MVLSSSKPYMGLSIMGRDSSNKTRGAFAGDSNGLGSSWKYACGSSNKVRPRPASTVTRCTRPGPMTSVCAGPNNAHEQRAEDERRDVLFRGHVELRHEDQVRDAQPRRIAHAWQCCSYTVVVSYNEFYGPCDISI